MAICCIIGIAPQTSTKVMFRVPESTKIILPLVGIPSSMCYISHYIYTQQDQITTQLVEYLVKHNQVNFPTALEILPK